MVKDIASHFKRSPVTIGEAIIKVEDLLRSDSPFEKDLTLMGENLIKGRKGKYRISVV
jgi:mRNA-degrading endonuclease RelE of RelBE toxin-antitoxin system